MSENNSVPEPPKADPGWNDPPKFTYDPDAGTPKVKLNLNKRVAFPMSQSPASNGRPTKTELAPSGLPMPHSKNAPPLMMPESSSATSEARPLPPPPPVAVSVSSVPHKQFPGEMEELSLDDLGDKATSAIEFIIKVATENELGEISTRLEACQQGINDKALSHEVLRLLVQIHEELVANKSEAALHYHQMLMVNYTTQCSLWGPAIKRIITVLSPPQQPSTIDAALDNLNEPEEKESDNSTPQVQYFQPAVASVVEAPPIPPAITPSPMGDQITADPEPPRPEDTSSSSSLFQKFKSRILHI